MIWINRVFVTLNIALFGGLLWFWLVKGSYLIAPGAWEYKDLVSILLTAVTVVLAFIGFIVAGAAIWGYQSIKAIAEERAEKISAAGCDTYLKSRDFLDQVDVAIRDRLETEAKNAVQNALSPIIVTADSSPQYQEAARTDQLPETKDQQGDQAWRD
jgi:hypothetical protein